MRQLFPGTVLWWSNSGLWAFKSWDTQGRPTSSKLPALGGILQQEQQQGDAEVYWSPWNFSGEVKQREGDFLLTPLLSVVLGQERQRSWSYLETRSQAVPPAAGLPQARMDRTLRSSWGVPSWKEESEGRWWGYAVPLRHKVRLAA